VVDKGSVEFDRRAVQRASVAIEAILFMEEPRPITEACPSTRQSLAAANDDHDPDYPAA
jgi:hypothetical protein